MSMDAKHTPGPCRNCLGEQWVCESHLDRPWSGMSSDPVSCHCGGAGAPCPVCCEEMATAGLRYLIAELRAELEATVAAIETALRETNWTDGESYLPSARAAIAKASPPASTALAECEG